MFRHIDTCVKNAHCIKIKKTCVDKRSQFRLSVNYDVAKSSLFTYLNAMQIQRKPNSDNILYERSLLLSSSGLSSVQCECVATCWQNCKF